jgi:hypothetical protein
MTADQVVDLRRELRGWNYGGMLPEPTVLATPDWLAYVHAMADAIPPGEEIAFPSLEDVAWAWPEGVLLVFDEPFQMEHTIISSEALDGSITPEESHSEQQRCCALAMMGPTPTPMRDPDGTPAGEIVSVPVMWIGENRADLISGHWVPGGRMYVQPPSTLISESSRLLLAIGTALGHRLTRLAEAPGSRAERRRVARGIPGGLRVLSLSTGATVRPAGTGSVDWQHRWLVRGHWRLQPYGPQRSLRRPTWIDPYVKGPEDKPLDVRQTIWTTPSPE